MNNYNPYTVPENFFEDIRTEAVSGYRKRRRAVRYGIATVLAAALIALPLCLRSATDNALEEEFAENNLAQMYDYDIFLQVNF